VTVPCNAPVAEVWAQAGAVENSTANNTNAMANLFEIFMIPPPPNQLTSRNETASRGPGGKTER
jgi:hypothetical protein